MKRAHILIVEDEPILFKRLKTLLKDNLYSIDNYTPSVDTAIENIEKTRPDLVLLDINLEGKKTGLDLGKILHNKYHIPFIYVTSYGDDQTFFESVQTGHEQFIVKTKPRLNENEVLRAVQTVLFKSKNESNYTKDGIVGLVDYLRVINESSKGEITRIPIPYNDIVFFTVKPFINENGKQETLKENYVWFQTKKKNEYFFIRTSLIDLVTKLPHYFARINDSYIVNLSIGTLNGRINGSRLSILNQEYIISERYKKEVKKRFEMLYD